VYVQAVVAPFRTMLALPFPVIVAVVSLEFTAKVYELGVLVIVSLPWAVAAVVVHD
jgi:hypothetical protein